MVRCQNCGAQMPASQAYCACGYTLQAVPVSRTYCPNCGYTLQAASASGQPEPGSPGSMFGAASFPHEEQAFSQHTVHGQAFDAGNPYAEQNYMPPMYGAALQSAYPGPPVGSQQKSRIVAGILGVTMGILGAHNFYLGHKRRARAQLLMALTPVVFGVCAPFVLLFARTAGLIDSTPNHLQLLPVTAIVVVIAQIWGMVEGVRLLMGATQTDADGVLLKD